MNGDRRVRAVVGGDVPSAVDPPSGCVFHPRCPRFHEGHCDTVEPMLEPAPGDSRPHRGLSLPARAVRIASVRKAALTLSSQTPPTDLKGYALRADTGLVDAAERRDIMNRYRDHSRRFEAAAARRSSTRRGSVIPFTPPASREVGQDPTARELEVLQLVANGLVIREIGERLFLSEETVKSHVRHLLAKLQSRSRASAVAVGFRRGLMWRLDPSATPISIRALPSFGYTRKRDAHPRRRTEDATDYRTFEPLAIGDDSSIGN